MALNYNVMTRYICKENWTQNFYNHFFQSTKTCREVICITIRQQKDEKEQVGREGDMDLIYNVLFS